MKKFEFFLLSFFILPILAAATSEEVSLQNPKSNVEATVSYSDENERRLQHKPTTEQVKEAKERNQKSKIALDKLKDRQNYAYTRYKERTDNLKASVQMKLSVLYQAIKDDESMVRDYCEKSSKEECKGMKDEISAMHAKKTSDIALEVANKSTKNVEWLKQKLVNLITEAEADEEVMLSHVAYMQKLRDEENVDVDRYMGLNMGKINEYVNTCAELVETVDLELTVINRLLVGNVCFSLDGGVPAVLKPSQATRFEKAVGEVVEDVLADEDIFLNVIASETVEHIFVPNTTTTTINSNSNNRRMRGLALNIPQRETTTDGQLLVRIMLTFRCKCREEDPVNDFILRSRKLTETQKEKYDEQQEPMALRSLQSSNRSSTQEKMEILLQESVNLIFGNDVTVKALPCGALVLP